MTMLLWDVDTQADFLHPDGRLYVAGAEEIIPNLARLTSWARDHRVTIISSACAHHANDAELDIYGPHCMAGTPGQLKVLQTLLSRRFTVPNHPIHLPDLGSFQQVIIEKQAFDVFTNPNTDVVLQRLGASLQIVLYGVVTEICVACAARGLLERGHKIALVTDAIRALDPEKSREFVDDFCARGGELTATGEVVRAEPAKVA